ncbi:MAG: hypothetical protein LBB38_01645 [Puniceicoccales bacterium]|jgi:hypothetical protein|nr:hypothetical protein [Puniceicoccales bacterium]
MSNSAALVSRERDRLQHVIDARAAAGKPVAHALLLRQQRLRETAGMLDRMSSLLSVATGGSSGVIASDAVAAIAIGSVWTAMADGSARSAAIASVAAAIDYIRLHGGELCSGCRMHGCRIQIDRNFSSAIAAMGRC